MLADYYKRFDAGEVLAASRLMSVVERGGEDAALVLDRLFPRVGRSRRIGLTGGTGSGKSTLVDRLIERFRADNSSVGVVAEDPTSPFTGGAILGDRVRMNQAIGDDGVFVRSVASRGSETGFSVLADELADVLDAFGRDVILLETIGVGQLEHRIRSSTDTTVVVFTPEAGDEVQSLKSGLMEIGDVFVVNKSDRPQADRFAADIRSILSIRHEGADWDPPVVETVAREGIGVDELYDALALHGRFLAAQGRLEARRRLNLEGRVRRLAEERLRESLWRNPYIRESFNGILDRIGAGKLSPYAAAEEIVNAQNARD